MRLRKLAAIITVLAVVGAACVADSAGGGSNPPSATTEAPGSSTVPPSNPTTPPATTKAPDLDPEGSGCTPGTDDLPDGRWYGLVTDLDDDTLEFDLACWFTGEAATKAAEEDGEESPPPNGYYVRNENTKTRILTVDADTPVTWYANVGDPTTEDEITFADWVTASAARGLMLGVWIDIEGGEVAAVTEQYVP